jgi:hypothetical protein
MSAYLLLVQRNIVVLDHTQWHTHARVRTHTHTHTLSRIPRHRDRHLITHNAHKRQISVPLTIFELAVPANEQPQTYALDRSATGFVSHTIASCCLSLGSCALVKKTVSNIKHLVLACSSVTALCHFTLRRWNSCIQTWIKYGWNIRRKLKLMIVDKLEVEVLRRRKTCFAFILLKPTHALF